VSTLDFYAKVAILAVACLTGCLFNNAPPAMQSGAYYSTSVDGLAEAQSPRTVNLKDGDSLVLVAAPLKKMIQGRMIRMLGYNGSIPGPIIRVPEGAKVKIRLENQLGFSTTLHAHGIRLDYQFDGAPNFSQKPIETGASFDYHIHFSDPGYYWYHSHIREDLGQQLGLYGNFIVVPKDSLYWNRVDREVPLVLSDILVDSAGMVPIKKDDVDHVLMGRFGNVILVNGDTGYSLNVKRNEYVRFYVTNAASSRVFNFVLNRTYMKVVGSDNGKYERSYLSAGELLAPGERMVFEAVFKDTGIVELLHELPDRLMKIGSIHVEEDSVLTGYKDAYEMEDTARDIIGDIDQYRPDFNKEPDQKLMLTGTMGGMNMPMKSSAHSEASNSQDGPGGVKGIEWYDNMGTMNSGSNLENTHWVMRDMLTGMENHAINWQFKRGDKVKIRVYNDSMAVHPMPHPLHFHGQRFLVVNVNGIRNLDLAWKDTYLIGTGETADLLLDASNLGAWMAHCHIAEHMEDMMMLHFRVN
jgi:suppressor of ftsI